MDRKSKPNRSLVVKEKVGERPVTRMEQVKTAVETHSVSSRWAKFKSVIFSPNGKLAFLLVFSGFTIFKVLKPMYKDYKQKKAEEYGEFLWEQERRTLKDK